MQNINIGTEINLQDLISSRLLIQANSGGGKSVIARAIIEQAYNKVPFVVLDFDGEYYTLKEHFGDIIVIGGQHADIAISLKSVKLLPKEIIANRLSVVIDLSDLQMNDRILYAKYFLETLMDLPKEYWVNYLIFLEEAHKLCGEQDKQASATAVKDLMSRGRKRGYCGILLTQRISKLHKDAAAECNNKFIGRTFLDIDLDRAAKELGLSSAADKNIIRNLTPGHFYAFGTSIVPHQVHTVKINLPKTKIPKAGVNLDIKPQKPTPKILQLLSQLNELPSENKTPKAPAAPAVNNQQLEKALQECTILKSERDHLNAKLWASEKTVEAYKSTFLSFKLYHDKVGDLLDKISTISENITIPKIESPVIKGPGNIQNAPIIKGLQKNSKAATAIEFLPGDTNLGKAERNIIIFLAQFPGRSFSKIQLAVSTNYTVSGGGFNNALYRLNTLRLMIKTDRYQVNSNAMDQIISLVGPIEEKQYGYETFKENLAKAEKEIYQVLIDNPQEEFTKEQIAELTETKYTASGGGFNNAIYRLNTLQLISKANGMIRLNPELLEL